MAPHERRKIDTAMVGVVLTLFLNFTALVWGAARLSAAVEGLQATTERLGQTVERIGGSVVELDKRITVIEATTPRR